MSPANPMLAWYGQAVIAALPGLLRLDPALQSRAVDLTLRDAGGTWWRPQSDGSWLRHGGSGWVRGAPPDWLEGVAPLPVGVAAVTRVEAEGEPTAEAGEMSAPEGLARGFAAICAAYRQGQMLSAMAQWLLAERMLLTPDGRLWTVGAQSQAWYAYGAAGWERQASPPAGPFVGRGEARAAGAVPGSPARAWAEKGPYLPEAVSAPWLPPAPPEGAQAPAPPPPPAPSEALRVAVVTLPPPPPAATAPAVPTTPAPAPPPAPRPASGGLSLLALATAVAVIASAFLPWRGNWTPAPFDTSATFLWNVEADVGWFSIGLVYLLLGLAALASVLFTGVRRYRRAVAGVTVGLAILWLVETARYLVWFDLWPRLGAMFTQEFAVGPWLALAAGLVLLLKRR